MLRVRRKITEIVVTASLVVLVSISGNFEAPVAEPVTESVISETEEETEVVNFTELLPKVGISGKPSPTEVSMLLSQIEEEETEEHVDEQEVETPETQDKTANAGINMANVGYVATLIESEAGNVASQDGRVAVALTAFKRTESNQYPDTLPEVVEQPYQYADLVGYYSDESYDAAVRAIRLWEEGSDETVLPDGYMYFFGYNRQNWFYRLKSDGSMEIYALPGQTVSDDVWRAFRKIVLKEVPVAKAEEEVQEAIEAVEAVTEEADEAAGETVSLPEEPNVAAEAIVEPVNDMNDMTSSEATTSEAISPEVISTPTMEEAVEQTASPSDI